MREQRLRAPKADGSILARLPLSEAAALVATNRGHLASWSYDFNGRSAAHLREKVRSDVLAAAARYHEGAGLDAIDLASIDPTAPIVATGHQPELFHPGVWVKNFAVASLADRAGGLGLNLIVDNDIPKGAAIRVPGRDGPNGSLKSRIVAFDDWAGESPYEDQSIRDAAQFAGFPDRVREVMGADAPASMLLDEYWPEVLEAPVGMPDRDRVGLRFARARRIIEAKWGVRNVEVPLSLACETEGFLWFACHLLAHLDRFRAVHNAALDRYRAAHQIRSKNHPVAALASKDGWAEAPFWAWRRSSPRRKPLQVRQHGRTMDLRIGGESEPFLSLPLAADRESCCAVEALTALPEMGIRLRTRALTTTMFARFLLGDLFVHGIGGAKYDELGDEVSRDFFEIQPPAFLTLSMTLHLGLPTTGATLDESHSVGRQLRDLDWQPERRLARVDEARTLIEEKRRLADRVPASRRERELRYKALRSVNARLVDLAEGTGPSREELEAELARIGRALDDDAVARSREYPAALFDPRRIEAAMLGAGSPVG